MSGPPSAGQTVIMTTRPGMQTPQLANALLVMAKRPMPGQSKTRLVPTLSHTQSATLYECFPRDSLELMRQVSGSQAAVSYTPGDSFL